MFHTALLNDLDAMMDFGRWRLMTSEWSIPEANCSSVFTFGRRVNACELMHATMAVAVARTLARVFP